MVTRVLTCGSGSIWCYTISHGDIIRPTVIQTPPPGGASLGQGGRGGTVGGPIREPGGRRLRYSTRRGRGRGRRRREGNLCVAVVGLNIRVRLRDLKIRLRDLKIRIHEHAHGLVLTVWAPIEGIVPHKGRHVHHDNGLLTVP